MKKMKKHTGGLLRPCNVVAFVLLLAGLAGVVLSLMMKSSSEKELGQVKTSLRVAASEKLEYFHQTRKAEVSYQALIEYENERLEALSSAKMQLTYAQDAKNVLTENPHVRRYLAEREHLEQLRTELEQMNEEVVRKNKEYQQTLESAYQD